MRGQKGGAHYFFPIKKSPLTRRAARPSERFPGPASKHGEMFSKSTRNWSVFTIPLIWNSKRTLSVCCCSKSIGKWLI